MMIVEKLHYGRKFKNYLDMRRTLLENTTMFRATARCGLGINNYFSCTCIINLRVLIAFS